MSEFAVAIGFVQFDPRERDVNGQQVRDVTIKAAGTQKLISITLWPEYADVEVNKGDLVAVDGKFEVSLGQAKDGSPREYINMGSSSLVVLAPAPKAERQVVKKATAAPKADSEPLF